jgi:hypothetical protein
LGGRTYRKHPIPALHTQPLKSNLFQAPDNIFQLYIPASMPLIYKVFDLMKSKAKSQIVKNVDKMLN